jgi:hypothetical protein
MSKAPKLELLQNEGEGEVVLGAVVDAGLEGEALHT